MVKIEEYRIEELDPNEATTLAADGSALELVEKLGLVGQKKLFSSDTKTRNPFRRMTELEGNIFDVLLPERHDLEKFDTEIIPLRILELAQQAKDSGCFYRLEVWHSLIRKDDPLLVGVVGQKDPQSWNAEYVRITAHFLIARWGETLLPFEQLRNEAKSTWLAKNRRSLNHQVSEANARLAQLDDEANEKFSGI